MEIGSVLELDEWKLYGIPEEKKEFRLPFMGEKQNYKSVFYQSGRNAIEALLLYLKETKGIQKMLCPDYMCATVTDAGRRAGVWPESYRIDRDYCFSLEEIEGKLGQGTCLFVAHFFGKKMDKRMLEKLLQWKARGVIVIEDITLSLFSSDEENGVGFGTYTLGSIRKWLPVPDGGFVTSCTEELPQKVIRSCVSKYTDFYLAVQRMKREYIQSGCENKELKKIYMGYYALSIEELFSDYQLYPMSDWTQNYLQNYELQEVLKKRIANYDYLYDKLSSVEGIALKVRREEGYLPLGMVIQAENREELLQYLIQNDIYCNVHWRLEPLEGNPERTFLSKHSLTIPCDQRYGMEEMDYIVDVLERWGRK